MPASHGHAGHAGFPRLGRPCRPCRLYFTYTCKSLKVYPPVAEARTEVGGDGDGDHGAAQLEDIGLIAVVVGSRAAQGAEDLHLVLQPAATASKSFRLGCCKTPVSQYSRIFYDSSRPVFCPLSRSGLPLEAPRPRGSGMTTLPPHRLNARSPRRPRHRGHRTTTSALSFAVTTAMRQPNLRSFDKGTRIPLL